jgi:hypothetical protein
MDAERSTGMAVSSAAICLGFNWRTMRSTSSSVRWARRPAASFGFMLATTLATDLAWASVVAALQSPTAPEPSEPSPPHVTSPWPLPPWRLFPYYGCREPSRSPDGESSRGQTTSLPQWPRQAQSTPAGSLASRTVLCPTSRDLVGRLLIFSLERFAPISLPLIPQPFQTLPLASRSSQTLPLGVRRLAGC